MRALSDTPWGRERRALLCVIPLVAFAPAGTCAFGAAWTNQAGHVIRADAVALKSGQVDLRRPDGTILSLPLSALCESDQRRVRRQFGESLAPDFAQAAFRDAHALIRRYHSLPPERRTHDEYARVVRMAQALYDARIAAHDIAGLPPEVQSDVRALRNLLR